MTTFDEALSLVDGCRNDWYGPADVDYGRTAGMFNAWRGPDAGPVTTSDALMFMVLVKLSRERHRHRGDNLVDAHGYLELFHRVVDPQRKEGI